MWRGAGRAGLGALLVVAGSDAGDAAQAVHPVLPDLDAVLVFELVGEEPVAQRRIVAMEVVELVDEVGVVVVPLAYGVAEPLVVPGPRKAEHPQRHRDRHPDRGAGRGQLADERVDHFGSDP